jgi:uncharacterized protein
MILRRSHKLGLTVLVAALVNGIPVLADEIKGVVKSVDPASQTMVVHDEKTNTDINVSLSSLSKGGGLSKTKKFDLKEFKLGSRVVVDNAFVAARIAIDDTVQEAAPEQSIFEEFWYNFRHNLFKPLLLFFYLGFLVPILKVQFEFPYVMYQALTIYLLLAIGWHGGEELAHELPLMAPNMLYSLVGFMVIGFITNSIIGILAYIILSATTRMRRVDKATVAGYYGSDSAGTFVTCLGVLATAHIAFDAFMPVMLALMEIPGCLVALFLVGRLRSQGMDAKGNMPDEPGYDPKAIPAGGHAEPVGEHGQIGSEHASRAELEMSLEKMEHPDPDANGKAKKNQGVITAKLMHEVFLNTGLYLLFGGIFIGFISGWQGPQVTREDDQFFVTLFQGVLCLFLLEMGMTASRKLRDLRAAGWPFVLFGVLAPNLFATMGLLIIHMYSMITLTHFELGSYALFAVLCGAASYIAVPAVQRLAIPEASPTLPLAASLGLTFSWNVTIGIPIYIEIAQVLRRSFPVA